MTGHLIIRKIMKTQGGDAVTASSPAVIFLIIQRLEVNYSNYTTVATPQDIDQMIDDIHPFKAFVHFFSFVSSTS